MHTRLCDMFGIEFPIFAFSHCRDVVAAVSKAGGFGVLGALAFTPEQLEVELKWIDEHVDDKPYGVDIVVPVNYLGADQGGIEKYGAKDLLGHPVGQIVGRMKTVRPTKEVIYEMVNEYVDTMAKMTEALAAAEEVRA